MADNEKPITDINAMEEAAPTAEESAAAPAHDCDVPNRWRRTMFIYITVGVAYGSIMAIVFLAQDNKLTQMTVDGFISYIMVTAVAYVAAHTIDRSEVLSKLGRRYNMKDE